MQSGDVIEGRYRLERQLGSGGMAVVWLAQDLRLERPVAVKLLASGDERERGALREQFLREARLVASVRHRNVVQVLDFGTHQERPFMVMEALEGESMADRLGRAEAFSLREVVEIALGCLEGLSAVHAAGIVHRDLKPENVFLVRDAAGAYPKLLDFGISKAADKQRGARSAVTTEAGMLLGTPEYMSPEQARGLTDLDLRTDLYSLAVVMYEALVGHAPYESEHSGDLLVLVIGGQAPSVASQVPEIPRAVSDVIERAMSREREQRFGSADAMRQALLDASEALPSVPLPRNQRRTLGSGEDRSSLERALAQVQPSRAPRVPVSPLALAGFALVLALAASVVIYALRAVKPAEAPRYIVVESGRDQAPRAPAPPPAPSAVTAPALPPAAPSHALSAPPAPERLDRRRSAPARGPGTAGAEAPAPRPTPGDPAAGVARAFDAQKASVVRCLTQHAAEVPEQQELAVRLSLAPDGRATQASVLPDALGASAVGGCIADATRAMTFPPQPGPLVVRVPITARRK